MRGGVSPVARQYPSIRPVRRKPEQVSIEVVADSIQRHLVLPNEGYEFTFGIQSWDPDLRERFEALYKPAFELYEENRRFRSKILGLVLRSWSNALFQRHMAGINRIRSSWRATLAQDYAGISQAIALSRVARLAISQTKTGDTYDIVVILRPDVILLKDIDLGSYDSTQITCNGYLDMCGDFRWILSFRNLSFFANLERSFWSEGRVHIPHSWIRDHARIQNISYSQDDIRAGIDEEVLRKTRMNGIEFRTLKRYGLALDEYEAYEEQ